MPTIPIFIREKQYQQLREISRLTGKSIGQLVREAVQLYITASFSNYVENTKRVVVKNEKKKIQES